MDYITGIQRAIDMIESHLCEEPDLDALSGEVACSAFYFQRLFSVLCGVTLGEYIRCRRLTLAGSELAQTDHKVIDIALKYGYDSPESFTRAFSKFHGITPSQARKDGSALKSFSRLSVQIIMKGGSVMDYKITPKTSFKVLEKVSRQSAKSEENKTSIPDFWTRCRGDGTLQKLCGAAKDKTYLFGTCYGSTQKDAGSFEYAIGVMCDDDTVAPEGFRIREIPARTWAVFACSGAMPDAAQNAWHRICTEFFPASGYTPTYEMDIEAYTAGDMSSPDYRSEIWVPVQTT